MVKKITLPSPMSPARSIGNPDILHCLGGAQVLITQGKHHIYKRGLGRAWCFEAVLKGAGVLICNNKRHTVTQGETYITSPFATFEYYPDHDDPWEKLFVEVKGSLIDSLGKAYNLHTQPIHRTPLAAPLIEKLNIILQSASQEEFIHSFPLELHRLCACFSNTKPSLAQQMGDYLDRKITEPFQLDEMAEEFGYSKNYIVRYFKNAFNTTPYKYVLSKRIEQACWALANNTISLKNLARELQFSDSKHLSSTLKKVTGKNPRQWRGQ